MSVLKRLTQQEYEEKIIKIKELNKQREYIENLKQEKRKGKKKRKIETSKIIALYLLALLTAIVVYAMVVMWKFSDLSYLSILISDIAAQILLYAIYCLKSYKAKKSEEELNFEKEKISNVLDNVEQPNFNNEINVG